MNIGIYIINSKDNKMQNAELVTHTQKKINFHRLKKISLFTGFIIIFKGQLRDKKGEAERGKGFEGRRRREERQEEHEKQ